MSERLMQLLCRQHLFSNLTYFFFKIDLPRELLQEMGKNNKEVIIYKIIFISISSFLPFVFGYRCLTEKVNRQQLPCHCHTDTAHLWLSHYFVFCAQVDTACPASFLTAVFIKFTFKRQHHLLPKNSPTLTYLVLVSWLSLFLDQVILCLLINVP